MSKSRMFERRRQASTWLDDLKKKDPKLAEAYAVVGNQPRWALVNMIKALKMMTALNTPEDEKRLAAAQYILRHTKAASGGDNFSSDREDEIEQPSTDDVRLASSEKEEDESAKTAAQDGVVKIAQVVSEGGYVTMIQTDHNTLSIVPNSTHIHQFIEDNSHHLHSETLEKLDQFVNPDRKLNQVWGDNQTLRRLIEPLIDAGTGWEWIEPHQIGALTDAPILEAPDGRIYWHERYAIESAADTLLLGETLTFHGAPENKILRAPNAPVPDEGKKAASAKVAEEAAPPVEGAPAAGETVPAAPAAPVQVTPTSAGGKYKYWTAEALTSCIEALSKTSDFANDKAAQEAVAGMSEELRTRPKQIEEQKTATKKGHVYESGAGVGEPAPEPCDNFEGHTKPWGVCWNCRRDYSEHAEGKNAEAKTAGSMGSGAPAVNEETSKVLEGDKSIPDGRDKVEDHTGITRPSTDNPSKFATSQPASANSTSKVIEGDKRVVPSVTGVEDHSGVKKPATTEPSKLASTAPPTNEETAKVIEGDKSVVPSVTGVEDHTGIKLPATTLPEKLAGINPEFIQAAQRAIENEDEIVYDVAAETGQIFGNIKGMKWFLHAVAEELESMSAGAEAGKTCQHGEGEDCMNCAVCGQCREDLDSNDVCMDCGGKDENAGMTGDAHEDNLQNTGENVPDPQALADHMASAKVATIEHKPGHHNSEGELAEWCNVKDGKVLDSHTSKAEAEKALRAHEYFKGASLKVASEVTTEKAIKLAESAADKLKNLYLEVKPITTANSTRPVREAAESVFGAMEMMAEAIKVLTKQKKQEEEEAAAQAAVVNRKKSSSLMGLNLVAAEE